jgi:hypothetical protein
MDERTINEIEQVLPLGTVDAAARHAERMAQKTGEFLRNLGLAQTTGADSSPVCFPAEFLLELAAIIQRADWEEKGLTDSIGECPSNVINELRQLLDRLVGESDCFRSGDAAIEGARLSRATLRVWLERFAWNAPELLQAEVALGNMDEDAFIDQLAEFLWRHRDDFFQPTSEESSNDQAN